MGIDKQVVTNQSPDEANHYGETSPDRQREIETAISAPQTGVPHPLTYLHILNAGNTGAEISPPKGVPLWRTIEFPKDRDAIVEQTADTTYDILRDRVKREMYPDEKSENEPQAFNREEEKAMDEWCRQMETNLTQSVGLKLTEDAIKMAMVSRQPGAETNPTFAATGDAVALLAQFDRLKSERWVQETLQTVAALRTGVNRMLSVIEITDPLSGENRAPNPDDRQLLLNQLDAILLEKLTVASIQRMTVTNPDLNHRHTDPGYESDRTVNFLATAQFLTSKTVELEQVEASDRSTAYKNDTETIHRRRTMNELGPMVGLVLESLAGYNKQQHYPVMVVDHKIIRLSSILNDPSLTETGRQEQVRGYLEQLRAAGEIPEIAPIDPRQADLYTAGESRDNKGYVDPTIPLDTAIRYFDSKLAVPEGFYIKPEDAEKFHSKQYVVYEWASKPEQKAETQYNTMFMFVLNNLPEGSVWYNTIIQNEQNRNRFASDFESFMNTPRAGQVMSLISYVNQRYQLAVDQNPKLGLHQTSDDTIQRVFALQVGKAFLQYELGEHNKFGVPSWQEFCNAPASAHHPDNDPRSRLMEASDLLDRAMGYYFLGNPDRNGVIVNNGDAVNALFLAYEEMVNSLDLADTQELLHRKDPLMRNAVKPRSGIHPFDVPTHKHKKQ